MIYINNYRGKTCMAPTTTSLRREDTQSGLWRPHRAIHSDNVSEICEMRNWEGTDKEQQQEVGGEAATFMTIANDNCDRPYK